MTWKYVSNLKVQERSLSFHDNKKNRTFTLSDPQETNPQDWSAFQALAEKKFQKLEDKRESQLSPEFKKRSKSRQPKRVRRAYGRKHQLLSQSTENWLSDDEEKPSNPPPVDAREYTDMAPDKGDIEELSDEEPTAEVTPERSGTGKYRRLQRKSIEDAFNEPDSDDEIFANNKATKPLVVENRVVTPTEQTKDQEDDTEAEDSPLPSKAISNFFKPKPKAFVDSKASGIESQSSSRAVVYGSGSKTTTRTPSVRRTQQAPFFLSPSQQGVTSPDKNKWSTKTPELSPVTTQEPQTCKKVLSSKRNYDELGFSTKITLDNEAGDGLRTNNGLVSKCRKLSPTARLQTSFGLGGQLEDNEYRGLRNIGNSCYLNADLQMLFTLNEFIGQIRGCGGDLASSIVRCARDVAKSRSPGAASPREVKDAMDKLSDKFQGSEQQDAHEFLGDLIDCIHEEMLSKPKVKPEEESTDSHKMASNAENETDLDEATSKGSILPTDKFFRCDVETCLKCVTCGYSR